MGVKWTTTEQENWLKQRLQLFKDTQTTKTTASQFFPEVHKEWRKSWPVQPPTVDDIAKAGGNVEKATVDKRKAVEDVSCQACVDMKTTYAKCSVFKPGSTTTAVVMHYPQVRVGYSSWAPHGCHMIGKHIMP